MANTSLGSSVYTALWPRIDRRQNVCATGTLQLDLRAFGTLLDRTKTIGTIHTG